MRLQAIKLAGFKSFVDPTVVSLPGDLNAIVGPNGCGKSNIIDAVRWVMGESSVRNLRGESMADVIFNGSSTRKPVGQASVELVLDNSDGRIGGEYAGFNEIAIRRTVTRDGQSRYLLNRTRCRRKDMTDLLSGTGLGPRSYSIIEQGMISDLIDARPEDLRVYVEEAAGITRYKDRRRETARRIQRTRENLEQLAYIREELNKQLNRLQRQAESAKRYNRYRTEEKRLGAQLQGIRYRDLMEQIRVSDQQISRFETDHERLIAGKRAQEKQLDARRAAHDECTRMTEGRQGEIYSLGTRITGIQSDLRFRQQRADQFEKEIQQLVNQDRQLNLELDADRDRLQGLQKKLNELLQQQQQAEQTATEASATLRQSEASMQAWQESWRGFSERAAVSVRNVDVEESRIRQLEVSLERTSQRIQQLKESRDRLQAVDLSGRISELEERRERLQQGLNESSRQISDASEKIEEGRGRILRLSAELDDSRSELQQANGRRSSLETLQQAALGSDDRSRTDWLAGHGLQDPVRLAEVMVVAPEWELSVETVLGDTLQAVGVESLDALARQMQVEGQEGKVDIALMETGAATPAPPEGELLIHKVECPWDLSSLFWGIHCVRDLQSALDLCRILPEGHSVITSNGLWLGPGWMRFRRAAEGGMGVLQRQREVVRLAGRCDALQKNIVTLTDQQDHANAALLELESRRNQARDTLSRWERERSGVETELSAASLRTAQVASDLEKTLQELAASEAYVQADEEQLCQARARLASAGQQTGQDEEDRHRLLAQQTARQQQLAASRQAADLSRDQLHKLTLEVQSVGDRLKASLAAMGRVEEQGSSIQQRKLALGRELAEIRAPLQQLEAELSQLLGQRADLEGGLIDLRRRMDGIVSQIDEGSQEILKIDKGIQELGEKLHEHRMHWQAQDVRRQTVEEQLQSGGFSLQEVLADLPEEAQEADWNASLEKLAERIQRLGPINLTAIGEFEDQSERKQYLDAQNEDLEQSLATLQSAIQRIDRETRSRFSKTFDQINNHLQRLFPELFGGGHAYLTMTGEDFLDTGVSLMARPPGKRNTSVYLLSGGEKALTAIALVFSIFSLNPAPFCLLDEVDAPLDDINVRRYSEMVKTMSRAVQFVYVTHNKTSMEMASHLLGVTTQEPGVSRLVSIDLGEAAALGAN